MLGITIIYFSKTVTSRAVHLFYLKMGLQGIFCETSVYTFWNFDDLLEMLLDPNFELPIDLLI